MFVDASTGEHVFGTDFPLTRDNDGNSPCFSGRAMMAWRKKPGDYGPVFIKQL
jgi:hypothetical protein